jgi:hypothetical protein
MSGSHRHDDEGGEIRRTQIGMDGSLFFETYEITDSNENLGEVGDDTIHTYHA